jgi:hypothetical protein
LARVPGKRIKHVLDITEREISRNSDLRKDWKQVAADAWLSPSWREAAIEYPRDRPPTSRQSPNKLTPSLRDIWRAAGQCVRRKAPHDALRTFLKWCDCSGVERSAGLPIFKTIVAKELAK